MAVRVCKVAGVTFGDDYPKMMHRWVLLSADRYPKVKLVRQPDNEHDPNAVRVMVGRRKVGHLPGELAAQVAPAMDAGRGVTARILSVDVWEDYPQNPTMTIEVRSTGAT